MWATFLSYYEGADFAWAELYAHEQDHTGNSAVDTASDWTNNKVGMSCGRWLRSQDFGWFKKDWIETTDWLTTYFWQHPWRFDFRGGTPG